MDAFARELFGGANAFPGRGDLNEDSFARDAGLFVTADERARLGEAGFDIETEAGIDFRGDATGDDFQNLKAERDGPSVQRGTEGLTCVGRLLFVFAGSFFDERRVFGRSRGLLLGAGIAGWV